MRGKVRVFRGSVLPGMSIEVFTEFGFQKQQQLSLFYSNAKVALCFFEECHFVLFSKRSRRRGVVLRCSWFRRCGGVTDHLAQSPG